MTHDEAMGLCDALISAFKARFGRMPDRILASEEIVDAIESAPIIKLGFHQPATRKGLATVCGAGLCKCMFFDGVCVEFQGRYYTKETLEGGEKDETKQTNTTQF